MSEPSRLSRQQASDGIEGTGWRYLLGALQTTVAVDSMTAATELATTVAAACAPFADEHLRLDLRPDRVEIALQTLALGAVTQHDLDLAHLIIAALPTTTTLSPGAFSNRPVQSLELAIDALDIAAVRPFWKAVFAYAEEPGGSPELPNGLVDPAGQLPTLWFQQMDQPREQRNRIHFDITVAHDEAGSRIAAALAAGGRLLDDSSARAFWILSDPEGNEVCVCTWQDRDGRQPLD